uniref:Uncharacterized protein n=1 Tax=Romanomermis culicivorax TaxID=13658 RepID=A0A915JEQ9_ROMCU
MHDHHDSIALANVCEVQKFQLEASDALEQLNTTTVRMTNNVLTVQNIDQIIGTISNQLQAQQLQRKRAGSGLCPSTAMWQTKSTFNRYPLQ